MKTIYCHFSFKRPKGKNYGLFAVAFYNDFDGKQHIYHTTTKHKLWENHQFITAIQAYENALATISKLQGAMINGGIGTVMLVTDNSTIAKWIQNPNKNVNYKEYMEKAVDMYRAGAPKEITIGVGLCEPRDYEKSYKYCKEELVNSKDSNKIKRSSGINLIDTSNLKINTIYDIENPNIPKIDIKEEI